VLDSILVVCVVFFFLFSLCLCQSILYFVYDWIINNQNVIPNGNLNNLLTLETETVGHLAFSNSFTTYT